VARENEGEPKKPENGRGAPKNGKAKPKREPPPPPPEGGFFSNLFRPLRKHRVTLTRPRQGAARGQKPKAAGPAKGKAKANAAKPATSPKPPTAHDRQVKELKTLARIGRQDPERLAGIISKMLLGAQEEEERAKLKFERLVWERAERKARRQKTENGGGKSPDGGGEAKA
jgi:hypothetical protein